MFVWPDARQVSDFKIKSLYPEEGHLRTGSATLRQVGDLQRIGVAEPEQRSLPSGFRFESTGYFQRQS
jgi:hypothetical protein